MPISSRHHSTSRSRAMLAITALTVAGCDGGILAPAGPIGREERIILLDALAIMLAIVIPTIIVALVFAWWYRASNTKAVYRPDWAYSGRIELIVWSIPTIVILFLSGVIWIGSHELDPAQRLNTDQKPFEVQVVSLDWKWLFIYPDLGVASVNELAVPVAQPVHFSLTSASVMNSFFVPKLGGMIATMNRMVTQLHLQADEPGEYYGRSTQFSGDGFPDMQFTVRAMTSRDFDAWIDRAKRSEQALNRTEYTKIVRPSMNVQPFTYRRVDAELFKAIVNQELAPGPGPRGEEGSAPIHSGKEH